VMPKKLAPKSRIWSTIFSAVLVSTSSGKAALPAETQCAQLLSHANVHLHGTISKGPFGKLDYSVILSYYALILVFNASQ
jgi:hypothetical protein